MEVVLEEGYKSQIILHSSAKRRPEVAQSEQESSRVLD